MINRFLSLTILAIFISSCSYIKKPKVEVDLKPDSLNNTIKADYKNFFSGDIEGFAAIFDQNDKITSTKIIKINGDWEDNRGIIRHRFVDNKGQKDSRTWLITLEENGEFKAIGHDSASPAKGVHSGNAIQIKYTLLIPYLGQKEKIDYLDTMYLIDENSMIKVSEFFKDSKKIGKTIVSLSKTIKQNDANKQEIKEQSSE